MAKNRLRVIFATFSPWEKGIRLPTNGMVEPMLSFFLPKTSKFTLIDEPHPGSDRVIPIIESYKNEKLIKGISPSIFIYLLYPFLLLRNSVGTRIPFKIRDFLTVIEYGLRDNYKYDLFFGLESVNTLAGVILKKFGRVKKVIYYVSDYSPNRYKSRWFNSLYLSLDKSATKYCDYIWDVSPALMQARIKAGVNPEFSNKIIHVPNGLFQEQIKHFPFNKTVPFSLVYAGTLGTENGPDIAIESIFFVKKKFPKVELHIYGGGQKDLKRLKRLVEKYNLNKNVIFHGFISDPIKLSSQIRNYRIGLAPYKAIPGSPRWWADATKIRLYLAAGLPVITTHVPPLGKELIETNSGLITKDNAKDIAKTIKEIFSNDTLYQTLRKNAIKKAKNNTWETTYKKALSVMGFKNI